MRIAGMFVDENEDQEIAQEIPLDDVTEETVMPKKKTRKAKAKSKGSKTRSSSKRKTVKRSKPRNLIATTSRSGKKINRAKAGEPGALAKANVYAMVVRVSKATHGKMWAKIRKMRADGHKTSLNHFVAGLIEKAVA